MSDFSLGSHQRLHLNRKHAWKIADDRIPAVPGVGRRVHLAAGGPEIDSAFIQRIHGHGIAQHVHIAVALRQALGQSLPLVSAGAAAEDAQLAVGNKVF